jgi:hypothetical protein
MKSKELVIKTLNHDSPDRIPRQCWVLPWAEIHFPERVAELNKKFPDDIIPVQGIYTKPLNVKGERYTEGRYVDEWGCIFNNIQGGLIGVPCKPLIETWDELERFAPPEATISVDKTSVNSYCRNDGRFIYTNAWIRPFERYQFIRSTELAMMDIAMDEPAMKDLLSIIHKHYLKEVETWSETEIDAIGIMDDWGMQKGMMVSPEFFRKHFKGLYREYAEIAHHHGKYVFMHSDGNITEIIPDLIEVGVDALNSQLFCMNIEELGRRFRGLITFWGEIDRQRLLPSGTGDEIKEAVKLVYENLYSEGGVIAECEFGPAANPDNIFTVFESWNNILKK